MSKSTKTTEERSAELKARRQADIDKANRRNAQIRQLEKKQKKEERDRRTNRLCKIGGTVEAVLGRAMEPKEIPALMEFLRQQEERGNYLTKFLANASSEPLIKDM